ncbi:hypothetical protein E1B28_010030 [Marasmius oreades]|uniref:Uncharacterized protein n=1 Tax=Marasmius oreades TaxID=181124 RepID=A0A9P7UQQ2_9AGAR|nr:uncharacterized protein E1B28_010030 [Marasmius oreades]KAG7090962.1 hypothetical protein E1B28_010030 [Marasmius oreades]
MNTSLPGDGTAIPPHRTSMDSHSLRSGSSRVRDREREKSRVPKASKESLVLLALEREENIKLRAALEENRKSHQELLSRAQQAETDLVAATSRIVRIHNSRTKLNEDVDRANALIQQYRVQLEAAQEEIRKAERAVQKLDELRSKEKKRAEKYKDAYRKTNEQVALQRAREEGRREGFREGLRQGHAQVEARYQNSEFRPSAIEDDDRQSYNGSSSHNSSNFSDSQNVSLLPSAQAVPAPARTPTPPPPVVDAAQYRIPSPPPVDYPSRPSSVSSPPLPIPTPMRNLDSNEPIRPVIIHQYPNFQSPPQEPIPPEGFIPRADPDTQRIPLPHQHELSRQHYMTQIPEPVSFPEPEPVQSFPEPDLRIIPPPGSYPTTTVNMMTEQQYRAAQSSPESASTVLSLAQMEIVNSNPNLRQTQSPMSTIMEAPSGQATPNTIEDHTLPRKSSMRSVSSSHRTYTPSNHVPTNWSRTSTDEEEEPVRTMTPSTGSHRSMGRKSSVKSLSSSKRGHSGGDTNTSRTEPRAPYAHYTYPNPASTPWADPRRDTTTPPVAPRVPYTRPTPPPQPPPQIYGIYAPPRAMSDIREEEERLTPKMHANRPLLPEQTRSRSLRRNAQDLHVDLPPPPNTASTLADDIPTPSSLSIGIDVVSPTPPESVHEEPEPNRTIREFLSPQDVQSRPLPPETQTQRSPAQSVPPPPPSMATGSPQLQALPDGGFFVPMSFTPKPTSGGAPLPSSPGPGIFVPQKFTPTVSPSDLVSSPRPTSPRPSSPSGSNMPGGYADLNTPTVEEPPVIPTPTLLRAAQNISDSDDDESGLNSEANTLTTPPSKTRGLPPQRGGVSMRGASTARARGKKKKR